MDTLADELVTDREELFRQIRQQVCAPSATTKTRANMFQVKRWQEFVKTPNTNFQGNITYKDTKGFDRHVQLAGALDHLFNQYVELNHVSQSELSTNGSGTHHRGQISAALTQFKHSK